VEEMGLDIIKLCNIASCWIYIGISKTFLCRKNKKITVATVQKFAVHDEKGD
jgi:hypothetical protein